MEEFGVFDQQAKRRGIPLKIHRLCRAAIEKNDIIPHFITGLIRQIVSPPSAEGSPSLESALSCLRSLLSWPAHRFFEEDDVNADEFELWRVSGTNWANVLSVEISGGRYPLVEFFYQCSQHSKPELRNEYVELMVLAASYTSADWDSETASFYAQRSLAILLEVLSTHLNPDTFDERRLSLLTSGCQRWFCAYADDLSTKLGQPTWMSLLDYFSDVTSRLMSIECVSNDNECLMSSLDAVLNCWFQLSLTAGQSTQRHPGVGDKYVGLFKHFVDCKLAHMTSDENINDFSASFADSHLQFVAKMGRESCVASCQFLAEKTSQLMLGWQSQSIPPFVAYEGLWTVFKLCSLFIADPADGEEPSVPGCFLALGDDAGALMLLINMLVSAQEPLLSLSDSPSVCGAYAEIFEKFIVTYSECAVPQYTAVFDDDTLLVFALHLVTQLLQKFAFEDEVDTVVSHLLRCLSTTRRARSSVGLRNAADTKVLMELSSSMQFNCSSVVRGRLYAYLLTHFASTSTLTLDQVAETFPVLHARRSSSLQNVLESLHVITGLFSSLTDAPLLQTLLPIFTDASEFASIYCVGHSTERQAALSLLEMQNASFLTWSGALEGGGILQVIRSCCTTVTSTLQVYASDRGWYTDEGSRTENSFLISISGLIGTLCKWKTTLLLFSRRGCCLSRGGGDGGGGYGVRVPQRGLSQHARRGGSGI
ncbi:hypothetical protein AGDE_09490 [Angomonas deanei]|uniref:Uncharacterized protein n=1 Tax=Angomonas deanei TaxID=59799 RepID=A0A7G2C5R6_9TRYP|nr:hypothetical protein AGDE_09490 [Angomonas deanei]CAD2214087.1 hypothetical protein, conserved [Angomonas deanei]|eukprot:EPY30345.1 hypothetical protein AGDE_09490 [Angomonas deanei]